MRSRAACLLCLVLSLGCGEQTRTDLRPPQLTPQQARAQQEKAKTSIESLTADDELDRVVAQKEVAKLTEFTSFPTVGIKLPRPPGFDDGETFHGFQQESTQASIMLASLPTAFEEIAEGMTDKDLARKGMMLRERTEVTIDGCPGLLLSATQSANAKEYFKWMLVFGDDESTKMITCSFPKEEGEYLRELIKGVVLAAKRDTMRLPEAAPDFGFRVTPSGKLKFAREFSKTLCYTLDGAFIQPAPESPLFIVARSIGPAPTNDKRQYSLQRLYGTEQTKVTSVVSHKPITIDGLDGYEAIADGEDIKSGTRLTVYQAIVYEGDNYYLMQGLVGRELSHEYLPDFKTMARSLTRTTQ